MKIINHSLNPKDVHISKRTASLPLPFNEPSGASKAAKYRENK